MKKCAIVSCFFLVTVLIAPASSLFASNPPVNAIPATEVIGFWGIHGPHGGHWHGHGGYWGGPRTYWGGHGRYWGGHGIYWGGYGRYHPYWYSRHYWYNPYQPYGHYLYGPYWQRY